MHAEILAKNVEDLLAALAMPNPSGPILLATGDYGALTLQDLHPAATLLLKSADPDYPAVFTGLILRDTENLIFQDITFDFTATDDTDPRPFRLARARHIAFTNVTFDGDLAIAGKDTDIGFPTGLGLSIRSCSDITIEQSSFHLFKIALYAEQVQGLTLSGNDISAIRMDGLQLAQVSDVTITGNFIHDFQRSSDAPDHADMIQFWTTGTKVASRNILIADNLLDAGTGLWTQSIFMRNELVDQGLAGSDLWYQNVTIRDNIIRNAHHHGITVAATIGLVISGNQVLWQRNAVQPGQRRDLFLPAINVKPDAKNVQITDNVFFTLTGFDRQADWVVRDNRSARNLDQ